MYPTAWKLGDYCMVFVDPVRVLGIAQKEPEVQPEGQGFFLFFYVFGVSCDVGGLGKSPRYSPKRA